MTLPATPLMGRNATVKEPEDARQIPQRSAIACTLASPDFKARLAWIAQLNASALREHHREGLQLELIYASEAVEKVREMVKREELCCAFLTFSVHEELNSLRLIIRVPEAAREVADMVFESFLAKAPNMQNLS
jgi:hypothetical protein